MHRTLRIIAAATGVAAVAAAGLAAAPAGDAASVDVDGSTITVSGTVVDGLGSVVIGADAVGDSSFSGLGADWSEMSVAYPEPGIVAFSTSIGDANPATGHIPHGVRFTVEGVSFGSDTFNLVASANIDTGLVVGAQSCAPDPDTGVSTCTTTPVEGGYADGAITWMLPTSAAPGDQVLGATAKVLPSISTGTTGGAFLNTSMDDMGITALATMPSATLLIDGVAAGSAGLSDAGYTVSVSDVAAGTHTLSLELCVDADCTTVELGDVDVA